MIRPVVEAAGLTLNRLKTSALANCLALQISLYLRHLLLEENLALDQVEDLQ
jgi:hypothetical protein